MVLVIIIVYTLVGVAFRRIRSDLRRLLFVVVLVTDVLVFDEQLRIDCLRCRYKVVLLLQLMLLLGAAGTAIDIEVLWPPPGPAAAPLDDYIYVLR